MVTNPFHKYFLVTAGTFLFLQFSLHSQALPQEPQQSHDRYVNTLKLMGEEEYDKAILAFQQLISERPDFHQAYKKIAEVYIFKNDLTGGQRYFEKLLSENPNNPYAHYGLARIDYAREEYDKAIENLKTCIRLDPAFAEAYGPSGGLAEVYDAKEDLDSAIRFFEGLIQADSTNACAYYGLANCYIIRYEFDEALRLLDQAVRFDPKLTPAYRSMALCYGYTAQYQKVIATSDELRKLAKVAHDLEALAYADMVAGNAYLYMGDYWKALQHFNESLKIAKAIGDRHREGNVLNSVAAVYYELGQTAKALEYFEAARSFAEAAGDQLGLVFALINTGNVYRGKLDESQQALQYYEEALELARKHHYKNEEALVLANLSGVYWDLSDYDKAFDSYQQALKIARETEDKSREGQILLGLGDLSDKFGKHAETVAYYQQALAVGSEIQDAQTVWQAHSALGTAFKNQNRANEAIHHYAEAIALYDSVRARLGIKSLGADFLEDKYEDFPAIVQLLVERERVREAFDYAEKYKAKTLLEVLAQAQTQLEALLPDSLRARLDDLQFRLEEAHAELSRLRSQKEKDKSKLIALDRQITDLELQKAAIVELVKEQHAAYYQLTSSGPLDIQEIQSRLLGRDQTLVEYLVGPKKLSVFVITNDTLIYRNVAIQRDSLKRLLADFSPIFKQKKIVDEQIRAQIFNSQLADFSIPPAYALYEVLIKPVEPWLRESAELIFVPDDLLFYLPFESLITDTTGVETRYDFERATFLIEKYVISYSPSASLLDPRLQTPRNPTQGLLALGNPDFGEKEEDQLWTSSLAYAGGVVRGNTLVSLPNSKTEVKAIGNVMAGLTNHIYTGNRATEEVFKKEAASFRLLHLATHFFTDDRQPLYSRIALAQDRKAEEDGYLQTYEVFNMRLNADLAVLSACNTGLGKLSKGEGLVGISRAFLYAGIPSLVVSLWSVDDEATSVIMKNFYKYLKAGLDKKQALRQAKIDYLKTAQIGKKDPFFWAPFILIGDWSKVTLPARSVPSFFTWPIVILLALLIITTTFLIFKRLTK